jgi:hypothetical protein
VKGRTNAPEEPLLEEYSINQNAKKRTDDDGIGGAERGKSSTTQTTPQLRKNSNRCVHYDHAVIARTRVIIKYKV